MSQFFEAPILHEGNRQQLVHITPRVERTSLMVRFAARLGLTRGNKSMMNAVEGAYSFVSGSYKPGDQVMFVTTSWWEHDLANVVLASLTPNIWRVQSLIQHVHYVDDTEQHDGTRPDDRSESHPSSGNNESPGKIPIYGVVVGVDYETRQMCEVNDELKSRFPPGVEHIVCWTLFGRERSCATRFDMTGGIVWREICITLDVGWDLRIHCTKHVIYWEERWIPKWDKVNLVWTQELNSFSGGAQDGLGWGLTKPVGMCRHELRKYHCLDRWRGDLFMLVWKSYRGVDQSHS
ncbi:unnamed protein product [Rhizoctonia solani]|uniref:Uncharacterized protein n=1 Tax=Rhizoctonia solani TaxID=456999 RepID=A0A8H2WSX4_9AGAM|nr:unnamed protein product [Rhizoctonia solani]